MDTPATLAFLGCCVDRPVSQPLPLSLFPKGNVQTASQLLLTLCFFFLAGVSFILPLNSSGLAKSEIPGTSESTRNQFRKWKTTGVKLNSSPHFPERMHYQDREPEPPLHTPFASFRAEPLSSGATRVAAAVRPCLGGAGAVLSPKAGAGSRLPPPLPFPAGKQPSKQPRK